LLCWLDPRKPSVLEVLPEAAFVLEPPFVALPCAEDDRLVTVDTPPGPWVLPWVRLLEAPPVAVLGTPGMLGKLGKPGIISPPWVFWTEVESTFPKLALPNRPVWLPWVAEAVPWFNPRPVACPPVCAPLCVMVLLPRGPSCCPLVIAALLLPVAVEGWTN